MSDRLRELLLQHSVRFGQFTLASGKQSDLFVDCKQTVLLSEGHVLVGERMLDAALTFATRPEAVAGVELGGCPLASAVALTSFRRGTPLDAVYVRKGEKDHGTRRLLEGDSHLRAGAPIVVLEDVVTTGGSTLAAVQKLRDRGLLVAGVVALVDREEGGADAIRRAGLEFAAVFRRRDLVGG